MSSEVTGGGPWRRSPDWVGDLELAEDAVQDACLAALDQWPTRGVPANPGSWLIGTAHHKALDAVRREARRGAKEDAAMRTVPTGRPDDRRTPSLTTNWP